MKIYEQGKKYYDALKSVNNLVKDARKVQQTILMVGDITDIYVTSFQKMLRDEEFHARRAVGHRLRLHEAAGGEQRRADGAENVVNITTLSMTDKERMDVVERCHSKMKRYRNLVMLLHQQEHFGELPACARRTKELASTEPQHGTAIGNMNESILSSLAIDFDNLHPILRSLYTEMMPLCSNMAGVGERHRRAGCAVLRGRARVWQSLARTEPIDVYPMLRPFAVGLCIMFFPTLVLGTINGVS